MGEHHEVALGIVGSSVKVLFPEANTRFDGIVELSKLIFGKDERKKRRLVGQLDDFVFALEGNLKRFERTEFADLNQSERKIALDCLIEALEDTRPVELIHTHLDETQVRSLLLGKCRPRWESERLSKSATAYGEYFTLAAARHLPGIASHLPDVQDLLAWETFVSTQRGINDVLELALRSIVMPSQRHAMNDEAAAFETAYLTDFGSAYGEMHLFGLDVAEELTAQRLDIGYVSLTVSKPGDRGPVTSRLPERYAWAESDTRSGQLLEDALDNLAYRPDRSSMAPERDNFRIVVRGSAGSGKTTVAQWLGITTASSGFRGYMKPWNRRLPFIVKFREVFRDKQPGFVPSLNALAQCSRHRHQDMPGDWIDKRLHSGRALLIFDGLDELPQAQRRDAKRWIDSLLGEYPNTAVVVTSRPEVDLSWYMNHGFTLFALEPLSPEGSRECVERWFNAVLLVTPPNVHLRRSGAKERLLADMNMPGPIRDLSETPLLCAMLCAYYAHKTNVDVQSKSALYESVIESLVHGREARRGSTLAGFEDLDAETKITLLQRIAYEMQNSDRSSIVLEKDFGELEQVKREMAAAESLELRPEIIVELEARFERVETTLRHTDVRDCLESSLRRLPFVRFTPAELSSQLVTRSIIFHKVSANDAQFAHRSIQEYLAARYLVRMGREDEALALREVHSRPMVTFLSAMTNIETAGKLILRLLDRASTSDTHARELLFLAAECAAARREVGEEVAERLRRELSSVLPPRSLDEATAVGAFGDGITPWLRGHFEADFTIRKACVRALALIGSFGALEALSDYASRDQRLLQECLGHWNRFEEEIYFDRVLGHFDLGQVDVPARSMGILRHMGASASLRGIAAQMSDGPNDLSFLTIAPEISRADCGAYHRLESTKSEATLPSLLKLRISGNRLLHSLEGLGSFSNLNELYANNLPRLETLSGLAPLSRLRVLILDKCAQLSEVVALNSLQSIRTLSLDGTKIESLDFCANMPSLRSLRVDVSPGLRRAGAVRHCSELARLSIALRSETEDPLRLAQSGSLRSVSIRGGSSRDMVALLGQDSLVELRLTGVWGAVNVTELVTALPALQRLEVSGTTIRLEAGGAASSGVKEIDFSGSEFSSLEGMGIFTEVQSLNLDSCTGVADLTPIVHCRSLGSLSLVGIPYANVDVVEAALEHCSIQYEPEFSQEVS